MYTTQMKYLPNVMRDRSRYRCTLSPTLLCALMCAWMATALCGAAGAGDSSSAHSLESAHAVTLPSPGSVRLDPAGRLGARVHANVRFLSYVHDRFAETMLEPFVDGYVPKGNMPLFNPGDTNLHWDGEYAGKWLDAAVRAAVYASDPVLLAKADAFAAAMRRDQQPDGYAMGIRAHSVPEDWTWQSSPHWEWNRRELWDVWNHWYVLTGQLTHYEYRGDRASLQAATGVGAWLTNTFGPIRDENAAFYCSAHRGGCNLDVIDQLARLYRHTGNDALREFALQAIEHYPFVREMRSTGRVKLVHVYVISAYLGGIVEWAGVTGDRDALTWVERIWERMAEDHRYPTGSLGLNEHLTKKAPNDAPDEKHQETCATVEWILLTERLYKATGHAKYIDALERVCYNALLAAQSTDGMKWTYYTPLRYTKKWFQGPTNCCYWSGPRGIARIPEMVYSVDEQGLRIDLFEQSKAKLKVKGKEVSIEQTTEYPAVGNTVIKIGLSQPLKFTMKLRTPTWATVKVTINGRISKWKGKPGTYLDIERKWADKDQVEMSFEMPAYLRPLGEHGEYGVAVARGPEVMSIDSRDNDELDLDSVRIPESVSLTPIELKGNRRCYSANVLINGKLTEVVFTPYADAGNDKARFRTVFPIGSVEM